MEYCKEFDEWISEQIIITSDMLDDMYEYFFEEE